MPDPAPCRPARSTCRPGCAEQRMAVVYTVEVESPRRRWPAGGLVGDPRRRASATYKTRGRPRWRHSMSFREFREARTRAREGAPERQAATIRVPSGRARPRALTETRAGHAHTRVGGVPPWFGRKASERRSSSFRAHCAAGRDPRRMDGVLSPTFIQCPRSPLQSATVTRHGGSNPVHAARPRSSSGAAASLSRNRSSSRIE